MSRERLGGAMPRWPHEDAPERGTKPVRVDPDPPASPSDSVANPDAEAVAFVRFCYRRRAVAWPELYDEMCAVAAHGDYRGLSYEQLENLGIRFVLTALPRLAEMAARVVAEERGRWPDERRDSLTNAAMA